MYVSSFASVSAAVERSSVPWFLCSCVFALFWRTQLGHAPRLYLLSPALVILKSRPTFPAVLSHPLSQHSSPLSRNCFPVDQDIMSSLLKRYNDMFTDWLRKMLPPFSNIWTLTEDIWRLREKKKLNARWFRVLIVEQTVELVIWLGVCVAGGSTQFPFRSYWWGEGSILLHFLWDLLGQNFVNLQSNDFILALLFLFPRNEWNISFSSFLLWKHF